MAQLTLALFSLDPHQLHSKSSAEFSFVLLPQLATTRPYVNAAAGALGAAYDKYVLHRSHHRDQQLSTKLYVNALRQVQDELRLPDPEVVPLLMAAMLLAAAESIQHKQVDALCHILFAFSMVNLHSAALTNPSIIEGLVSVQDLFHSVDYHISMFAWGRPPQFPPLPVTHQMLYPACIDDLTAGHPTLQQWSLHFIAKALGPEWEERIDFPPALVAQQAYLVAWLKRWLRTYTLLLEAPCSRPSSRLTPHFRILKAQTLTMYIATSNIKPPTQVAYDTYAPQFEEIIRCAEHVLYPNDPTNTSAPHRHLLPYSPIPGIIHPLCFTARKYRHSVARRRAIHLLRHAGIEGPFQGAFEARVVSRLVEIEEDRKPFKQLLAPAEVLLPSDIADRNRVYICWIEEPPDVGQTGDMAPPRRVIKFSRRRKVAPVSRACTKMDRQALDGDCVMRTRKPGVGEGLQPAEDEGEMWEVWEEVVEGAWPRETWSCH